MSDFQIGLAITFWLIFGTVTAYTYWSMNLKDQFEFQARYNGRKYVIKEVSKMAALFLGGPIALVFLIIAAFLWRK